MSYFDLALPLSVLLTVGVAVVLRRRSFLAVAASGFAATNALALIGLVCAEAVWNRRPEYAWRFDDRYLDGAIRGLGAFLFYSPALQSQIIVGVASVSAIFAGLKFLVKQPARQANTWQFTMEMVLAVVYFCAVIAWFIHSILSVYVG